MNGVFENRRLCNFNNRHVRALLLQEQSDGPFHARAQRRTEYCNIETQGVARGFKFLEIMGHNHLKGALLQFENDLSEALRILRQEKDG